jgi:hypothetical protein
LYDGVWHLNSDLVDATGAHSLNNEGSVDATGQIGRGRTVSPSGDRHLEVDAPASDALGYTGAMTVEGWFRPAQLHDGQFFNALIGYGGRSDNDDNPNNFRYYVALGTFTGTDHHDHVQIASFWEHGNGTDVDTGSNDLTVSIGQMHHIAVTRSASATTFYFDGVNVGSRAESQMPDGGTNNDFRIGGNVFDTARNADGVIDEVRISGDVKSADWIDLQVRSMRGDVALAEGSEAHP